MVSITIEIPTALYERMEKLVAEEWFKDMNSLVEEALRRYLEHHPMDDLAREESINSEEWREAPDEEPFDPKDDVDIPF